MQLSPQDRAKRAAAKKALEFVQNGMTIGLGSGTTSAFFIEALGELVSKGLLIKTIASSHTSESLAKKHCIPLIDINAADKIDLTVDGADEIDPEKRMIKGAGGALLREKILASLSRQMIVIVDESKLVEQLGRAKLPVEIFPFGSRGIEKKLHKLGLAGKWRMTNGATRFITENGNLILDLEFTLPPSSPEHVEAQITRIPGVIETGFFFDLASLILVGSPDGLARVL